MYQIKNTPRADDSLSGTYTEKTDPETSSAIVKNLTRWAAHDFNPTFSFHNRCENNRRHNVISTENGENCEPGFPPKNPVDESLRFSTTQIESVFVFQIVLDPAIKAMRWTSQHESI